MARNQGSVLERSRSRGGAVSRGGASGVSANQIGNGKASGIGRSA